ncbi:hypothetical protein [Nitrosophilus kaiyonis]|uniref:hypothetical protein n=1 Tax=Nitrosophilus kaiyonis TaxID=2930200 RepID=UPI00248F684B|nr:hypothetical protein [Nitrosophilus kaiyonis]
MFSNKILLFLFSIIILIIFNGCTRHARLYNLNTGNVLTASFKDYGIGHGEITLKMSNGTVLKGEYSTINDTNYNYALINGSAASNDNQYAWAIAQGFSFNQPGKQFGSAIVSGEGIIIDIVYVVDPWTGHGYGVGKDNKGNKYKIQF